jgi:hypothetical protein
LPVIARSPKGDDAIQGLRVSPWIASPRFRGGRNDWSYYSAICWPDPPNSAGKSFSFGSPSRIGSTVSV